MDASHIFVIGIMIVVIIVVYYIMTVVSNVPKIQEPKIPKPAVKSGATCSASSHSCAAIDPVNDPAYNMKETIKNTLLIEQHLAEKNKYCKECLVKHFLISIALLEEAEWMACKDCNKYPMLIDSKVFFKKIFKEWHAKMDDDATRLEALAQIREWRQKCVRLYYF